MADLFGQDIKLAENGQALVAANGALLLTAGPETGVQDVGIRLACPLGELFYQIDFGSLLYQYIKDENSQALRAAFEAEVEQRIEEDPRVVLGSVECKVVAWDSTGFTATARWNFITEDHPFNLVIGIDNDKKAMVIKDVNPRASL